jgi:hypothetical protein
MNTPQKKPTKTVWNKQRKRKSKLNKDGNLSLATWDKLVDMFYSPCIRLRDSEDGGITTVCYTCGKTIPINDAQNGHFVPRAAKPIKYDERNTHAQCYRCNVALKGNLTVYAERMINDYGVDIIAELNHAGAKHFKGSREYYEAMYDMYRERLAEMDNYAKFTYIFEQADKIIRIAKGA